ncbi:MAG: pirin family protein [Pseudomonas sp.]|jgi:redox-sensitive bicupin YhaK (pirin superfamily)|uniref:Pirin family protein n=2 Tax=Pseudomonas fluorescens group TaxID=136843 RepID=A0ABY0V8F1_9PSED|nr:MULTISPECIES: pirin family protein [Pseudomonas]MBU0524899.1 pirin family protein [Gammaproteobacteria bacterium]MDF9882059.1 redox-sensitive bicupin YhaK (pirin superfamily) [Pseudomonas silensiensis]MBU0817833.1 pirin family protein [Gammaproteobacteria bacterium]MBU0841507.1 pirin family protein [Gammaproteobacteria bacterium]MBU1844282.1 pirin family protein [Gammaproteobacteria bacterium]
MKNIIGIYTSPRTHWVGDGFPVRTLFSYDNLAKHISPFLLLDHAGPAEFTPTTERRGVGQHPHRGFETVTIVYKGEVEHRDSTGSGGRIGPGDVQWMTAASGILHEEFHSEEFARTGGTLEMVQLWVNLPARDKMADAGYQTILDGDIPNLPLKDKAGSLRLIAGEFEGHTGPARTFTPIDVWDLRLNGGKLLTLDLHEGRNTALVVLRGTVEVNGLELMREGQLALFERDGHQLSLEANDDAVVLLLSGEPIDEPIVGHGPFVMNSEQEIHQAFADFQSGRFGQMSD